MNKCSPVEMRKNLEVIEYYKMIGLDFVAIPVKSEEHKKELIKQGNTVMDELVKIAESEGG